ncbi:Uncharacterised protein [Acinetobacter baumannii]|nr:Uncharacterised protein [Acinetobacter baumannii]SVK02274.1 Uncharacterised protein [Acinetobacter baumannii]
MACSMTGASSPINTTTLAYFSIEERKGEKSCPLPCPPKISATLPFFTSMAAPKPSIAASVAPTLVPLESL